MVEIKIVIAVWMVLSAAMMLVSDVQISRLEKRIRELEEQYGLDG